MKPRILITGCSGLIGSRMVIQANQSGMDVLACARGRTEKLSMEIGMPVIAMDVLQPIMLPIEQRSIDAIIHCATSNDIVSRDFGAGVELSVIGTRNILEYAIKQGIKRVIFFSTLQVYGTELSGEVSEESPVYCQSPYALNHLLGEEVCRMYTRNQGIDVVLLRPSNVFGIPDVSTINRDTLVPSCFVKEAVELGSITLRTSGRQARNFISTHEVAKTCLHILNNFPSGCTVVNLSSNWLCCIREIAEITKQVYWQKNHRELPINILADEPKITNRFSIKSRFDSLRPSVEESRKMMFDVISQLFESMNKYKEISHVNN